MARTTSGDLEGFWARGVAAFRGVPYAAAPTGGRRFQAPAAFPPWSGRRPARAHGPVPPQPRSRLGLVMGDFERPQDEDCLTLTITAPEAALMAGAAGAARAVLVFLHGGAYLSGAGSLDWYDGAVLAREGDVVVVGVNYRLGALGFLHHPALSEGSLGLADMVAALEWIQANIASFGGDPASVTVFGQSAGGHAIMMVLGSGKAGGLFRRAILQSAPAELAPLSRAKAAEHAVRFLQLLGIAAEAPDAAARLAEVSAARLVEAQMRFARTLASFADATPPFLPVDDALSDPSSFIENAARGAGEQGIEIVLGTTAEEMHAFFAPDPAMAEPDARAVAALFERLAGTAGAIHSYRQRRPGARTVDLISDLVTDYTFLFPTLDLAEALLRYGAKVWMYRFDWAPAGSPYRACHCLELPFIFGTPAAWASAPMLAGGDAQQIDGLGRVMREAWVAFAATGSPSLPALEWPAYDSTRRPAMRFADRVGPVGDVSGASWRPRGPGNASTVVVSGEPAV